MEEEKISLITKEVIMRKIYLIMGKKEMLDLNLAELCAMETKELNRQYEK